MVLMNGRFRWLLLSVTSLPLTNKQLTPPVYPRPARLTECVPVVGVNSDSHETEVQQINAQRAVVRLKDRATIPNKNFLLTYRVAGSAINDAVLTHRSERGGFFTLIL